jgi:hypothetical protein
MIKKEYDANTGMYNYVYKDIRFSVSHEILSDIYYIDVVEEIKRGIDIALKGYNIEPVVDLKNKTAKLIITKRTDND